MDEEAEAQNWGEAEGPRRGVVLFRGQLEDMGGRDRIRGQITQGDQIT